MQSIFFLAVFNALVDIRQLADIQFGEITITQLALGRAGRALENWPDFAVCFALVLESHMKYSRIEMCGAQCRSRSDYRNEDQKQETTEIETGMAK